MKPTISEAEITKIVAVEHHDPFTVLGNHVVQVNRGRAVAIRVYDPFADRIVVVDDDSDRQRWDMRRIHPQRWLDRSARKKKAIWKHRRSLLSPATVFLQIPFLRTGAF